MKSIPQFPSEDHPRPSNEHPPYREKQSSIPSTEQSPNVLTLAVISGLAGLAIASVLNLNSGAGFIIGFLVGFLIFWIRLVLLERRTDKTKAVPSIPGDRSITIAYPESGAITVNIMYDSIHPNSRKEGYSGE